MDPAVSGDEMGCKGKPWKGTNARGMLLGDASKSPVVFSSMCSFLGRLLPSCPAFCNTPKGSVPGSAAACAKGDDTGVKVIRLACCTSTTCVFVAWAGPASRDGEGGASWGSEMSADPADDPTASAPVCGMIEDSTKGAADPALDPTSTIGPVPWAVPSVGTRAMLMRRGLAVQSIVTKCDDD